MAVRGKTLLSAILGLIGSIMLLIAGFVGFGVQALQEAYLNTLGLSWGDVNFDPIVYTLSAILTLVWGLLGLFGAILSLIGNKLGAYLMVIIGIIATIGMFIPIGAYQVAFAPYTVNLNGHLFFADPILILIGGILGLLLKES